jgi:hypothetical protein
MNDKQKFLDWKKFGLKSGTEEDHVKNLVNQLIESLYIPVKEWGTITRTDPARIEHFGIDDSEPINWGDLKCISVTKDAFVYDVLIDEAAPDECPTFCAFIETMMASYGWDVIVQTEW